MVFKLILYCCIIQQIIGSITANRIEWIDHLVAYIKNDAQVNHVLLLTEDYEELPSPAARIFVRQISTNIPTRQVASPEIAGINEQEEDPVNTYLGLSSTTMVIFVTSNGTQQLTRSSGPVDFVLQLAGVRSRPRCLVLSQQKGRSGSYKKFLRYMWTKQFLDVTVLELTKNETTEEIHLLNNQQELATIHQYNPFTNAYIERKYSSAISWFPDKTRNMHGHLMKVGVFDDPPLAHTVRNHTGHVVNGFGADIKIAKNLAKASNFTIAWVTSREFTFGDNIGCSKERSTGLVYGVMSNELQFIAVQGTRYATCDEYLYEWGRGSRFVPHVVVVPMPTGQSDFFVVEWKVSNALAFMGVLLILWLIPRLLRFKKDNWNIMYMIQIVLGSATPREPVNSSERLVFGSILLACLVYTSFLYTTLTSVSLRRDPVIHLRTLEDIASSSLELVCDPHVLSMIQLSSGEEWPNQFTEFTAMTPEPCTKRLRKAKDVACFTKLFSVREIVLAERDECGKPVMRVIDEQFRSSLSGFLMESGSPYVKRFDFIIQRLVESGLARKWREMRSDRSYVASDGENPCSPKNPETMAFRNQILKVLFLGYASSLIVFIGEMIMGYLNRH